MTNLEQRLVIANDKAFNYKFARASGLRCGDWRREY